MPSLWVAVPFLFTCGFATVYFLGARGLCRYACPYGGLLLPADQLAVGRVVVDMSKCDQCGICTAACTAGVRVHDEVRLYGSVTDRNCVRSFDCIGACPQDALRFSFTRPALLRSSRAPRPAAVRPDLSLADELIALAAFLPAFFILRGLYELIPLLLAATLAVLIAFLAWKIHRLFRDPNVRLGPLQLRTAARLRPAGRAFLLCSAVLLATLLHSVSVRALILAASAHDDRIGVPYEIAVAGQGILESDRTAAIKATRLYSLARPLWRGGIALASTPSAGFRLAWVSLVAGDKDRARAVLGDLSNSPRAGPNAPTELARLLLADNRQTDAIALLEATTARQPRWAPPRDMLAFLWATSGHPDKAQALYRDVLARRSSDAPARIGLARLLIFTGRHAEGVAELKVVVQLWPRHPTARRELALALYATGEIDNAITELEAAAAALPASRADLLALADEMRRHAPP